MVAKKISAYYTLKKCKRIFYHSYRLYKRKRSKLELAQKEKLQSLLNALQKAILQKEVPLAQMLSLQLSELVPQWMPKTLWDRARDFISAIGFALLIAVIVRCMWFELYTIPTGSMRPTFKEGDFILASKTNYGINIPLKTSHFYFNPSLVQRGATVILTSENLDISDADTTYFYLFPGKKQFIKRMIGKPGDTLYFYGGQIYGIDSNGEEIKNLREPHWMQKLEHIPFIKFEGTPKVTEKSQQGVFRNTFIYQMNEPIAKLKVNTIGKVKGEMIPQPHNQSLKQFADLWGFKNYAMARLLKPSELKEPVPNSPDSSKALLYLELIHHPSLEGASIILDEYGRYRPGLHLSRSIIPLSQEKIDLIASHLITARFIVQDGLVHRLGAPIHEPHYVSYLPRLPDVPNGTYEIQDGIAYEIGWGGIAKELPPSHPLYNKSSDRIYLLYNLGIEFDTSFLPSSKIPHRFPSRYAYFRDGSLYLLGAPIFQKEDPELIVFLKKEHQKQAAANPLHPYFPFEDAGAPLKDGKIDKELVKQYGLTLPEKMYLVLGDNHAMSGDSRQFGFVPQDNLRGGASFIFWPPGPRWGRPPQAPSVHLSLPTTLVWGLALLASLTGYLYYKRALTRPLKF